MPQESHDHNFKNVFLDFPRESLELFYPQALEQYGELQEITFVRQEPRKIACPTNHGPLGRTHPGRQER